MTTKRKKKKATQLASISSLCLVLQFFALIYADALSLFFPIVCGVLSIPALIWLLKSQASPWQKILIIVMLLVVALPPLLFSHRTVLLLYVFALMCATVCTCLFCSLLLRADKKCASTECISIWMLEYGILFVYLMVRAFDYSFIGDGFIPFLPISLALGGTVTVAVMAKWLWKGCKFWGRIGYSLLLLLVTALFVWVFIAHLNYTLDPTEPETYSLTIEEKEYDMRRKGPDSYQFVFALEGDEFRLEVPVSDYDHYNVGDEYPLKMHQGAFGKAFYLSGKR